MVDDSSVTPAGAEQSKGSPRRGLVGAALELALAGIGLAGLLGDEAQALYRRSIERGQGDVNKVRQRLKFARFPEDVAEPSPRRPRGAELAAEEWRAALDKLNLPTATQVRALTQQVADLEAKIEKLRSGNQD